MGVAGRFSWSGFLTGVQPRARLTRSYDERDPALLGYILRVRGQVADEVREFTVAVGAKSHEKHRFHAGLVVSGAGFPVEDPLLDVAELERASGIEVLVRGGPPSAAPPWRGEPPPLSVYRDRGFRRLAAQAYTGKCSGCQWGCKMAVEMILDPWHPDRRRYRTETFCFGPLSCPLYRAGPTRKVPGRRGPPWEEEDWVDEAEVSHRGPED